jgi:CBS domain-containing protein
LFLTPVLQGIEGGKMQQIQKPISAFLSDKPVVTIAVNANVMDAVEKMNSEHTECLLVVDNEKLAGIFTERDFLNRVISARLIPSETAIADVMTANPDTLGIEDAVSYAVERMASRGFRNIPIINNDETANVLTVWDVMSHLSELLTEFEENDASEIEEWTDIGGG